MQAADGGARAAQVSLTMLARLAIECETARMTDATAEPAHRVDPHDGKVHEKLNWLRAGVLGLGWGEPIAREQLSTGRVAEALERLRHLAPLRKPGVLKACVEAAAADGAVGLAEGELVRMVAATLDCPVPPLLTSS